VNPNYRTRHKSVSAWLTLEQFAQLEQVAARYGITKGQLITNAVRTIIDEETQQEKAA